MSRSEVEVALGYTSTKDPSRGTALCYRWEEGSSVPKPGDYNKMMELFGVADAVPYEAIMQSQTAARRPFNATPDAPYADVWTFKTVTPYKGKHVCEKPQDLLRHIIRVSSRPGDTVLDSFAGSGSTGVAAQALGREFIGIEKDEHWAAVARERVDVPLFADAAD